MHVDTHVEVSGVEEVGGDRLLRLAAGFPAAAVCRSRFAFSGIPPAYTFFFGCADSLNFRAAALALSGGKELATGDAFEVVISLKSRSVFNSLGANDAARQSAFTESVRRGMLSLLGMMRVAEAKWVAVAHLPTNNPHAHVLIRKKAWDSGAARARDVAGAWERLIRRNPREPELVFDLMLRQQPYFAGYLAGEAERRRARTRYKNLLRLSRERRKDAERVADSLVVGYRKLTDYLSGHLGAVPDPAVIGLIYRMGFEPEATDAFAIGLAHSAGRFDLLYPPAEDGPGGEAGIDLML